MRAQIVKNRVWRALPFLLLAASILAASGCRQGYMGVFGSEQLYGDGPVPVLSLDTRALNEFISSPPDPAPATFVTIHPSGLIEPAGTLAPEDYQPELYGHELKTRLDLRSFPSLLIVPDHGQPYTPVSGVWKERSTSHGGCTTIAPYAIATYKLVASFDYDADGRRDWLVVATQQVANDESLMLILWLLVEAPRPEGALTARLLGMEERKGIAPATRYMSFDSAVKRLDELRQGFGYPALR